MFGNLFGGKNETILGKAKSDCSKYEWEVVKTIHKEGFFFTYVSDNGESSPDSFAFTTGIWKTLKFPEIITFGLPADRCHAMFSDIFYAVKQGADLPFEAPYHHTNNLPLVLVPARREANNEYLLTAKWFYGTDDFPTVQLFYSDMEGRLPWDKQFDNRFPNQPDLTAKGFEALSSTATKDAAGK